MSKITLIKKIASIAIMEAIIVATMFLLLILLKMIGVDQSGVAFTQPEFAFVKIQKII